MDAEQRSEAALGALWNALSQAQRKTLIDVYHERDTSTNKITAHYRSQTLSSKALSSMIDQKSAGYTGSFYIKPLGIDLAEFAIMHNLHPQPPFYLVMSAKDIQKTATMNDVTVQTNSPALAKDLVELGYVEVSRGTYHRHASFLMNYYHDYFENKAEAKDE